MNSPQQDNDSFEHCLAELERIVRDLEGGELGLEDSLARYETGVRLLKQCYARLQQAEQRILLLAGIDSDGKPVTRPFDHNATAESAKPENKDNKRKRPKDNDQEILF